MEVVYTRHARNRMRERSITRQEIETTVNNPEKREILGSNRFHVFRRMGNRHIRVTYVFEDLKYIIISAVDKLD